MKIIKEKFILVLLLLLLFGLFLKTEQVLAVSPDGDLNQADNNVIAGWAKDDDFPNGTSVHVYVDGQFVKPLPANLYRKDVGNHAFHWNHPSFGPGTHRINVYVIGVNSAGVSDDHNPEITNSPKTFTEQEEYSLTSNNQEVTVTFNAKFGGAITKIFDSINMAGLNLVNDNQAGAMFQNAFWFIPYHSWVDPTKPVPPDCNTTRNDMQLNNPTQAGYVGDGLAGNPIGIQGTDNGAIEPEEFIRYEDSGKTIHFKTKFIRYDYCQISPIGAPLSNPECDTKARNSYLAKLPAYYNLPPEQVYFNGSSVPTCRDLWDTNFYLEQWASFHPTLPRVLVLKSKFTYVGQIPAKISTRQLPVIFAFWLTKGVYWENGQKVEVTTPGAVGANPDQNWVALLSTTKDAGIGMVTNPRMQAMLNRKKFLLEFLAEPGFNGEPMADLCAGGGVSDLRLDGILTKVTLEGNHLFVFENGGTYETVSYYPIGTLDMIKQASEEILNNSSSFPRPPINILDLRHFLSNFLQSFTIFDYNKIVENFGQ